MSTTEIKREDIAGVECRFVTYIHPPEPQLPDRHYVKEVLHLKNGQTVRRLNVIENYKRPFYITKPGYRTYKQRKEWEDVHKLDKFMCRQTDLSQAISAALGRPGAKGSYKMAVREPYVYGADIPSSTLIKRSYRKRFPDFVTPYSVAVLDTEADMVHGHQETIMCSLTMKEKAVIAIQKASLKGLVNPVPRIHELIDKYLGEFIKARNITVEIYVAENEFDVFRHIFQRAHEWQPDFLAIWNMYYDIGKIINCCRKNGVDPKILFSDPSVPEPYRYFKFQEGQTQKVSDSGKKQSLDFHRQWHTVVAPASFYVIDPMCLYKQIRIGSPEEDSYSLDFMLKKVLKLSKLKFAEADGYEKGEWHTFMQKFYMLEYAVYNLWDCISVELFDEATLDMQLSIAAQAVDSGFDVFNKMPRKIVEYLDDYVKPMGKIMGTTSAEMVDEFNDLTLGVDGWIVTLSPVPIVDNGIFLFADAPHVRTRLRKNSGDLDVAGAYPNNGIVLNQSKETTRKELCSIEGIHESVFRAQNMNLTGGSTNASQYCREMFGAANYKQMLDLYRQLHPAE